VPESRGEDMTDYRHHQFSKGEYIRYGLMGMAGSFFVLYLFYWNVPICLILSLAGGFLFIRYEKKEQAKRDQWQLTLEFKDAMDSFVSALVAGYSMDNAVREAYRDLQLMYEKDTPMLRELKDILQKLRLRQPLDELFMDLGRRSGVEDIITFSQIYATARRSGGNLVKVMKRTADNIGEKVEVQREIQTMIAGKKMESSCMMVIPLFIIVYLQIFSPGFLQPLYEGVMGRAFMTFALAVYVVSVFWSRKIMSIQG
jgi:tight adherence protein B